MSTDTQSHSSLALYSQYDFKTFYSKKKITHFIIIVAVNTHTLFQLILVFESIEKHLRREVGREQHKSVSKLILVDRRKSHHHSLFISFDFGCLMGNNQVLSPDTSRFRRTTK